MFNRLDRVYGIYSNEATTYRKCHTKLIFTILNRETRPIDDYLSFFIVIDDSVHEISW